MNYRFFELTKKALYGLCLAVISGGFLSCNDRFPLDDEGNYPSWLGSSVYEQLKNPNPEVLTGTFNNYVRLIEDMGYAETLGKTGSKTVFAANDEATTSSLARYPRATAATPRLRRTVGRPTSLQLRWACFPMMRWQPVGSSASASLPSTATRTSTTRRTVLSSTPTMTQRP